MTNYSNKDKIYLIRPFLFFCVLSLYSSFLFAEKPPMKWGKIDMDQLKMKTFKADSNANAVILGDYGEASFETYDEDLKIVYKRHTRIKILNKAGFDWANIAIPYYKHNRIELVIGIKGMTYTLDENGKMQKTKLNKKQIFDEDIDGKWHQKKFALPNVQEGAIIEYSYQLESTSFLNFRDWYFQNEIPTLYSEFRAEILEYFEYVTWQQGLQLLTVNDANTYKKQLAVKEEGRIGHSFSEAPVQRRKNVNLSLKANNIRMVAENLPALREEPFMSSTKNHRAMIGFQLRSVHYPNSSPQIFMTNWQALATELLDYEFFGMQLKRNRVLKQKAKAIAELITDPKERMIAIYDFVRNNMNWNGSYNRYASQYLKKSFEQKKGSSSDINLMLTLMLKEAGLDAHPVLVSTRDHGKVRTSYPIIDQFNHLITFVDINSETFLLNAIHPNRPYHTLAANDLNEKGFVLRRDNSEWVELKTKQKFKHAVIAQMSLQADGTLQGGLRCVDDGYSALSNRNQYLENGETAFIQNKIIKEITDIQMDSTSFPNATDDSQVFKSNYYFKTSEFSNQIGDKLYFQPMLGEKFTKNIFKAKERLYPIDLGFARTWQYILNLDIPEGYVVEELPKPAKVNLGSKAGSFTYIVNEIAGNKLQLMSKINLRQTEYPREFYEHLKEFFDLIITKHKEQIIFTKK